MAKRHYDNYLGYYVNPYTDFGFKRLFGTEVNKELLISFLNTLLQLDEHKLIKNLTYLDPNQLGDTAFDRRAVFDVYCESQDGSKFIVEMQRSVQNRFADRSVFYASFPIRSQAERGQKWNYELKAVYLVGVLDFCFDDDPIYFHHKVQLLDTKTHKVFFDRLTFVYLEMPKFNKSLEECKTFLDKWFFVLKNIVKLNSRPKELQEKIFEKFFKAAKIANFDEQEYNSYEKSLKIYRDLENCFDSNYSNGKEEGIEEGIEIGREEGIKIGKEQGIEIGKEQGKQEGIELGKEQGKQEGIELGKEQGANAEKIRMAKHLKSLNVDINTISQASGLTKEEIEKL